MESASSSASKKRTRCRSNSPVPSQSTAPKKRRASTSVTENEQKHVRCRSSTRAKDGLRRRSRSTVVERGGGGGSAGRRRMRRGRSLSPECEQPRLRQDLLDEQDSLLHVCSAEPRNDQLLSAELHAVLPRTRNPRLRMVVIDGSNVACAFGRARRVFDCRGILVAVQYFLNRGHHRVIALVPRSRASTASRTANTPTRWGNVVHNLEKQGLLEYTPSRCLDGQWQVAHDDAFILRVAEAEDAVVVSNDQFREFLSDPELGPVVRHRLLSYMIVAGKIYFADDPFGLGGTSLKQLLTKEVLPFPHNTAVKR